MCPDPSSGAPGKSATPAPSLPPVCWSCRGIVGSEDKFCRHCGRRQMRGDTWYFQAGWILFLAFTVLGPFALPLIWRSTKLDRGQKWFLASVVIVYTALVFYLGYVLTKLILDHFLDFNRDLKELRL